MKMSQTDSNTPAAEFAFRLKLYITGTTPSSTRALVNVRRICEEHLAGRYELEVVDILKQPHRAQDEQILAAPTLVKHWPLPVRRFIGDMSEPARLIAGFGLSNA